MSEPIRLEREGGRATLWLDAPPLNILDLGLLRRLGSELEPLHQDERLQLLLVRSASPKAFSAGVSIADHAPETVDEMLRRFHHALELVRRLPCPTLAVVEGHCLGGGMELAGACDWVLAAENAVFGQPEIGLGCFPPYAAALYPRRLGTGRTLDLLLTGRRIDAATAEHYGFVTWRAASDELEGRLRDVVGSVLTHSAIVLRLAKRAVLHGVELPLEGALAECERIYLEELAATADMREGLAAFAEKRQPAWKHR